MKRRCDLHYHRFGGLRCTFTLPPEEDMSRLQLQTVHPQGSFAGAIRACGSTDALVSLFHRSVANSFLYGDATGRIGFWYGLLLVVAEHVGCCCYCCLLVLLLLLVVALRQAVAAVAMLLEHTYI